MNTKPGAVRIVYSIPEAPKARINYSFSSNSHNLSTPSRKRRTKKLAASQVPKRPRIQHTLPLSNILEEVLQEERHSEPTTTVPDPPDYTTEGDDSFWNTVESVMPREESHKTLDEVKFSFFVEAVGSEQCTFVQLTQELFIANDWNLAKDEATVSIIIIP